MCAPLVHKARPAKKQKATTFIIDCSKPVDDGIMKMDAFERYLQGRIKVNGKAGLLGEDVRVSRDRSKVAVTTDLHMAKRYLKYLTKKFLKKHSVRDWLRVIASPSDRNTYELRYFNIADNEVEVEA